MEAWHVLLLMVSLYGDSSPHRGRVPDQHRSRNSSTGSNPDRGSAGRRTRPRTTGHSRPARSRRGSGSARCGRPPPPASGNRLRRGRRGLPSADQHAVLGELSAIKVGFRLPTSGESQPIARRLRPPGLSARRPADSQSPPDGHHTPTHRACELTAESCGTFAARSRLVPAASVP
jgi:hypothetical protein